MAPRTRLSAPVLDHAIVPGFLLSAITATYLLLRAAVPSVLISGLVVGTLAALAAVLERVRPERADYRQLDQPLGTEVAHFFLDYNLGYALALGACALLARALDHLAMPTLWPTTWPAVLQIVLAIAIAEGISYWQHRLIHRRAWYWPFHALHHTGDRLNLARSARFHFLDIGPAALIGFAPLVVLGAPDAVLTWFIVLSGILGVLQHSNMRVRTAPVLDRWLCTPAVHRFHHSRDPRESNSNFGTTTMLFDRIFKTYVAPSAPGPQAVGVAHHELPPGFVRQLFAPFRQRPLSDR